MELSPEDIAVLDRCCQSWTKTDLPDGWCDLVLSGYRLPAGLTPEQVDLLVRLPPQFPDVPPDMFWTIPDVTVTRTGAVPNAASHHEVHAGRTWQRFSRHLAPGAWKVGTDDLQTWLAAIHRLLTLDAAA